MTGRVTVKSVCFTQPFRLGGITDVQAPGTYPVTTREEQTASDRTVEGWHCISTTISIPRDGTAQDHRIDPVDLDTSLLRDKGPAVPPPGEI
jgi:hypothetical protein